MQDQFKEKFDKIEKVLQEKAKKLKAMERKSYQQYRNQLKENMFGPSSDEPDTSLPAGISQQ